VWDKRDGQSVCVGKLRLVVWLPEVVAQRNDNGDPKAAFNYEAQTCEITNARGIYYNKFSTGKTNFNHHHDFKIG